MKRKPLPTRRIRMRAVLWSPRTRRLAHEVQGSASGAFVGAVLGAAAGPEGMVAGAILGGVAGVVIGAALDIDSQRRAAYVRELDDELYGVRARPSGVSPRSGTT